MANKKLIGEYPAIGIRPIVDGRRGPMQLRESLEPQVMAMAEAAKKLFEDNLRYPDGTPVRVVMAAFTRLAAEIEKPCMPRDSASWWSASTSRWRWRAPSVCSPPATPG